MRPLQQTLKDLERAYSNFFAKRAAFPRFKKKGHRESFRFPDPKQIKLDQGNSRDVLGEVSSPSSIRDGRSFAASSNTSWLGPAAP